ncbi:MAG: pantetheine-phosphate adenylyltransferase [Magnetospirillum sp. WYHS-4]
MDIIGRAVRLCDRLIVAVAANVGKGPLFPVADRVAMIEDEVAGLPNGWPDRIEVRAFDNLLMHFVREVKASIILRGLRAVSDFEYEFQMAGMNTRLDPSVETVFLMASEKQQFIASRFVKEIARLGGDVGSFVTPRVRQRLDDRLRELGPDGLDTTTRNPG